MLKFIKNCVGFLSHVFPKFTGWLIFWIFCIPRKRGYQNSRNQNLIERAFKKLSEGDLRWTRFEKLQIATYHFMPSDVRKKPKKAIILHGWTGQSAFMTGFVEPLTALGYEVILVDLPGHGQSEGRYLSVIRATRLLAVLNQEMGPFDLLIGHSFGGLALSTAVAGDLQDVPPLKAEHLILIAAPASVKRIFSITGKLVGLTDKGLDAMNGMVLKLTGRPIEDFEGQRQLAVAGIKTLVLHDPEDKIVMFKSAKEYASAGSFVTLKPLKNVGHQRILFSFDTFAGITEFLSQ